MEEIRLDDSTVHRRRLVVALLVHHHFELHLRILHHMVHHVMVAGTKLSLLLEEILCRVVLLRCAAQAVRPTASRQIAHLRLH